MQFFRSGLAHFGDSATEAHVLAGKGMVEVHHHLFVCDFKHLSVDTVSLGCHHRNIVAYGHVFIIKFSLDFENRLVEMSHLLGVVRAEAFGRANLNIKCITFLKTFDCLFKGNDYTLSNSKHYALGAVGLYLMYQFFTVGCYYREVIYHLNIFSGFDFFHNFILLNIDLEDD